MNKLKSRAFTVYLFGDRGSSRRELFFRKSCVESLRIRKEKTSEIRAERGKIHYDHGQREKIHSPCQTDGDCIPRMQTSQRTQSSK
jgi:hypothetical protein